MYSVFVVSLPVATILLSLGMLIGIVAIAVLTYKLGETVQRVTVTERVLQEYEGQLDTLWTLTQILLRTQNPENKGGVGRTEGVESHE